MMKLSEHEWCNSTANKQSSVSLFALQRAAGSSSDGTADSDDSTEQEKTDSSHSDANPRSNARLTRASVRLSQSSQGKLTMARKNY